MSRSFLDPPWGAIWYHAAPPTWLRGSSKSAGRAGTRRVGNGSSATTSVESRAKLSEFTRASWAEFRLVVKGKRKGVGEGNSGETHPHPLCNQAHIVSVPGGLQDVMFVTPACDG